MGLDNGINIKCKSQEEAQLIINEAATYLNTLRLFYGNKEHVEVCYWRKCWNIRREILSVLRPKDKDQKKYLIELDDIKSIIFKLYKFLDSSTWENDDDGSIWVFDEYKSVIMWNILNLSWLFHYKVKNPEIEIYFYDSY